MNSISTEEVYIEKVLVDKKITKNSLKNHLLRPLNQQRLL